MATVVCRTCLRVTIDLATSSLNGEISGQKTAFEKLKSCVPELVDTLVIDAKICKPCSTSLDNAYTFKMKCLEADHRIKLYIKDKFSGESSSNYGIILCAEQLLSKADTKTTYLSQIDQSKNIPGDVTPAMNCIKIEPEDGYTSDVWYNDDAFELDHNLSGTTDVTKSDEKKELDASDSTPCHDAFPNTGASVNSCSKTLDNTSGVTPPDLTLHNNAGDVKLNKNISHCITRKKKTVTNTISSQKRLLRNTGNGIPAQLTSRNTRCLKSSKAYTTRLARKTSLCITSAKTRLHNASDQKPKLVNTSNKSTKWLSSRGYIVPIDVDSDVCDEKSGRDSDLESNAFNSTDLPSRNNSECNTEVSLCKSDVFSDVTPCNTGVVSSCVEVNATDIILPPNNDLNTVGITEEPAKRVFPFNRNPKKKKTNSKVGTCDFCPQTFDSLTKLYRHIKRAHGPEPYRCTQCNYTACLAWRLNNHVRRRHVTKLPYKCSECDYTTSRRYMLKRHVNKHNRPSGPSTYICYKCNRIYTKRQSLVAHLLVHKPSAKKFVCDRCGYRAHYEASLRAHMEKHTDVRSYACELCDKRFKKRSLLKSHMICHRDIRPYVCDQCGMSFKRSDNMLGHRRLHSGDKPFECTECSYSCASKPGLKRHIRIHTGEKPYACELCNYRANQLGCIKLHMKVHAKEVVKTEER